MPEVPFWIFVVIIIIGLAILYGIFKFIKKIFFKLLLALFIIIICAVTILSLMNIFGAA